MLTPSPMTTTDKLTKKLLGKWINTHRDGGQWLSYQDQNGNFYTRMSHKDTEWKVYERMNKCTQLKCIDTAKEN